MTSQIAPKFAQLQYYCSSRISTNRRSCTLFGADAFTKKNLQLPETNPQSNIYHCEGPIHKNAKLHGLSCKNNSRVPPLSFSPRARPRLGGAADASGRRYAPPRPDLRRREPSSSHPPPPRPLSLAGTPRPRRNLRRRPRSPPPRKWSPPVIPAAKWLAATPASGSAWLRPRARARLPERELGRARPCRAPPCAICR